MSKNDLERQRRLKKARKAQQKEGIKEVRTLGQKLKPVFRTIGCDLPFYDFIDNYAEEFQRIATEALATSSSLTGVYEVDQSDLDDTDWRKFGLDPDKQVQFSIDDKFEGYGKKSESDRNVNMRGATAFFLDGTDLKSAVLVQERFKSSMDAPEMRYIFKIGTLLHELGHVHDGENRINMDPYTKRFDIVEAEAFAHCYALDRLADRCLKQSYDPLYEVMESWSRIDSYEGEIGRLVLKHHAHRTIPNWNDFMEEAERVYIERHSK